MAQIPKKWDTETLIFQTFQRVDYIVFFVLVFTLRMGLLENDQFRDWVDWIQSI